MLLVSGTATVTIIVADANTHPPEFQVSSFYFTVPESRAVGDVVGFVSAQDADLEYNAQRTYSIVGGNPMFYMDSIYQAGTGAIKVKEVRCSGVKVIEVRDSDIRVKMGKPSGMKVIEVRDSDIKVREVARSGIKVIEVRDSALPSRSRR